MIRRCGRSPSRAWSGAGLSVVVALASLALPFLITPRGIEPDPGSAAATNRTERMAVHEVANAGMPEERRDGSHPHEAHCFWCIALVGPIVSSTLVERVQVPSLAVPARSSGIVRPRGLDLSCAPRAPPLLADLPL